MATEKLKGTDAPGNNVYFVVWNAAGQVLDFSDNTFKALGSATTPYVAATEVANRGGVDESGYEASLDLANVNATPAIAVFEVEVYRRLGGSPAVATDVCLGNGEMRVALSSIVLHGSPGDIIPGYVVKCAFNVTSTAGNEIELVAWAEYQGNVVDLDPADDCSFDLFQFGGGVSSLGGPTTPVNPNAVTNQFEDTVAGLTLVAETSYSLQATATIGGVTINAQGNFQMIGSS